MHQTYQLKCTETSLNVHNNENESQVGHILCYLWLLKFKMTRDTFYENSSISRSYTIIRYNKFMCFFSTPNHVFYVKFIASMTTIFFGFYELISQWIYILEPSIICQSRSICATSLANIAANSKTKDHFWIMRKYVIDDWVVL